MDKKTFCAAPWFQIRTSSQGYYRSCCVMQCDKTEFAGKTDYQYPHNTLDEWMDSDYLNHVKTNLANGIQIPECNRCWVKEKYNETSLRQIINDSFYNTKFDWIEYYFNKKNILDKAPLVGADIKLDNTCNYACIMCNPMDSSKVWHIWDKNKHNKFVRQVTDNEPDYLDNVKLIYKEKNNYDLLVNIINKKPKYIKLLGGEPLLDKKMFSILESVDHKISKNITLIFITNGSVNLVQTSERLEHFKDVQFAISLEGVGAVQDYLRRGSTWKDVEQHILEYQQKNPRAVHVHYTLQALSIFHFADLAEWCNKHHIPLNFGLLSNPPYLSIEAIPPDLKKIIHARLKHCVFKSSIDTDNDVDQNSNIAQMIIDSNYNDGLLKNLQEFVQWYDPDLNYKKILPEWTQYFEVDI